MGVDLGKGDEADGAPAVATSHNHKEADDYDAADGCKENVEPEIQRTGHFAGCNLLSSSRLAWGGNTGLTDGGKYV